MLYYRFKRYAAFLKEALSFKYLTKKRIFVKKHILFITIVLRRNGKEVNAKYPFYVQ